jgi:predicted AAA+ superfamily ATPase
VCVDLHAQAETREVRSLVHAAKELDLKEGIVVTPDLSKEWVVDGITIRAIPLYLFIGAA